MIIDLEKSPESLPTHVDICIVGSGPAGLSLALRLLEKKPQLNVAVLEGGGRQPSLFSQQLYEGESIGTPQHPPQASRVRAYGGTSNLWSGWCNPFSPDDFERKTWIKDSGWPINYQTIAPYYLSAYNFFDVDPRADISDNNYDRYSLLRNLDTSRVNALLMHHSYPAMHVGYAYESVIEKASKLNVYLNANLTKVNLTKDGTRVRSLQVTHNDRQRTYSVSANDYVLACGGLENPRILLASTDVKPEGVGNDQDCVGRYFIDHLHSWNARVMEFEGTKKANYVKLSKYGDARVTLGITPTYQQRKQMELANAVSYFSYFAESPSDTRYQQLEAARTFRRRLEQGRFDGETAKSAVNTLRNLDSLILKLAREMKRPQEMRRPRKKSGRKELTLTMYAEQTPNRESRVQLERESDELGMPKPVINWQPTEQDRRSIRQSTLLIGGELAKAKIGRLQLHHWLTEDQGNWPGYLVSSRHPMGTTRMSSNKLTGVVDEDCGVHGVKNLYISGSSVFPTGGYANPTLTIVALAQRLADHLSARA